MAVWTQRLIICIATSLLSSSALADCYGWKRATDYGRSEQSWQCAKCLQRGHYPASHRDGEEFCVPETKQNGEVVYIFGDIVTPDFDWAANAYCGCHHDIHQDTW